MSYQISEETRNKTTRCIHNFTCLTDKGFNLCSLDTKFMGDLYFVKTEMPKDNCNYCISFGNVFICSCPTRHELYERYKI